MVLYLPGFGSHNKGELESFTTVLKTKGFEVFPHEWQHWKNDSIEWNVNAEIEIIKDEIGSYKIDFVVAKSIGTYIASTLIWQKIISPQKIILMGVPINDLSADENEFLSLALKRMEGKVTFIQNTSDPHGSLEDLNGLVSNIKHDLMIKDSDNHEYNYPEDVLRVLQP